MWQVTQSVQSPGGYGWSDTLMNGLGRNETRQNLRERRLWMRDTIFLGKKRGSFWTKKNNYCLLISLLSYTFLLSSFWVGSYSYYDTVCWLRWRWLKTVYINGFLMINDRDLFSYDVVYFNSSSNQPLQPVFRLDMYWSNLYWYHIDSKIYQHSVPYVSISFGIELYTIRMFVWFDK